MLKKKLKLNELKVQWKNMYGKLGRNEGSLEHRTSCGIL